MMKSESKSLLDSFVFLKTALIPPLPPRKVETLADCLLLAVVLCFVGRNKLSDCYNYLSHTDISKNGFNIIQADSISFSTVSNYS